MRLFLLPTLYPGWDTSFGKGRIANQKAMCPHLTVHVDT